MMCRIDYQRDKTGCRWERCHFNSIHQSKPNILAGNNKYRGSTGYYCSYSNK